MVKRWGTVRAAVWIVTAIVFVALAVVFSGGGAYPIGGALVAFWPAAFLFMVAVRLDSASEVEVGQLGPLAWAFILLWAGSTWFSMLEDVSGIGGSLGAMVGSILFSYMVVLIIATIIRKIRSGDSDDNQAATPGS